MAVSRTGSKGLVGKTIGGFEILSELGEGGMGMVYKARQIGLDRLCALKVLPPHVAKSETFIQRFQREARASAKLSHPNIVAGIDVGFDKEHGVWFFAMEYIDGPSMYSVLQDAGKVPELRALEIGRQIAEALDCAHKHGMVHRDIKPDNILMTNRGEARLADLGLARRVDEETNVTAENQAVGTPLYMAPEQARGDEHKIDIRTDIYCLGATLYHFVTGSPPFLGKTAAVIMTKHITDPPPLAHVNEPTVRAPTGRLIEKMMQKSRSARFQTPREAIAEIDKVMAELKDPGTPPTLKVATVRRSTTRIRGSRRLSRAGSVRKATAKSAPLGKPADGPETDAEKLAAPAKEAPPDSKGKVKAAEADQPAKTPPKEAAPEAVPVPESGVQPPESGEPPRRQSLRSRRLAAKVSERRRTVRGVALDLIVLFVVVGLVGGGVYWLRREGKIGWPKFIKTRSEESMPAQPEAPNPPAPAPRPDATPSVPEGKEHPPPGIEGEADVESVQGPGHRGSP